MFFANGNIFERILGMIVMLFLLYFIVRGLFIIIPIGICIWIFYKLYKFLRNSIENRSIKRKSESFVKKEQVVEDDSNGEIVDVDYEDIG
ncbi:hypothetical protein [Clostridium sp. DL1XJH146]